MTSALLETRLNEAVAHHQAGRLAEAEALYRKVLERDPDHIDANHLLGVIALQTGAYEAAVELIGKSVAANPDFGEAHCNLGVALMKLDRTSEAIESYRRAIAIRPDHGEALFNLGKALNDTGQADEAMDSYQKALACKPDYAEAHFNLGNILADRDRPEDAREHYRRAIGIDPDYAEAHDRLGVAQRTLGHLDEAMASHHKALDINPDLGSAHNNLGLCLQEQSRNEDAVASYQKALDIDPDSVEARANLGNALKELGRLDEAVNEYNKALTLNPEYAEIHYNLGLVYLLMEDFANGWQEYDWRWRKQNFPSRRTEYDRPLWDGGDITGKRLLVWSEQGVGDELLFAGLIPDLMERGIDVVVDCDPRLAPLFARSFPSAVCVPKGEAGQAFDCHIPIGGLGRILRPSAVTFPDPKPYLHANPELRTDLRERYLAKTSGPLVGLSWFSDSPDYGPQSSLALQQLRPLLEIPGITFVDLQYGDTTDQRSTIARETGNEILHDDQVDQRNDMDTFAAQIAAMDLVVSIDNSIAHLAGALGVPTWGLLRFVPFWLWGLGHEDSRWYPSVRLFRQDRSGDWDSVVGQAAALLSEWPKGGGN